MHYLKDQGSTEPPPGWGGGGGSSMVHNHTECTFCMGSHRCVCCLPVQEYKSIHIGSCVNTE